MGNEIFDLNVQKIFLLILGLRAGCQNSLTKSVEPLDVLKPGFGGIGDEAKTAHSSTGYNREPCNIS